MDFNSSLPASIFYDNDDHYIPGCHGTLAEQEDEAFYDDRVNSDDDLTKGRITFPSVSNKRLRGSREGNLQSGDERVKLYGRQQELKQLRKLHTEICSLCPPASPRSSLRGSLLSIDIPSSKIVYVSGCTGTGKTAFVEEFLIQPKERRRSRSQSPNDLPLLYISSTFKSQSRSRSRGTDHLMQPLYEDLRVAALDLWVNPRSSGVSSQQRHVSKIEEAEDDSSTSSISLNELRDDDDEESKQLLEMETRHYAQLTGMMNKIKANDNKITAKSMTNLITFICTAARSSPFALFMDDLQNIQQDEDSMEILKHLLLDTSSLGNLIFILSYSTANHGDQPLLTLLEGIESKREYDESRATLKLTMHPLTYDVVMKFCADATGREVTEEIESLARAVYEKTLGIVFYVRDLLEEVCYYDVMCFTWTWTQSKLERLEDYLDDDSDGIVYAMQLRLKQFPIELQRIMMIMSCIIQDPLSSTTVKELLENEGFVLSDDELHQHLQLATREGLLVLTQPPKSRISFAHDYIHRAARASMARHERNALLLRIFATGHQKWNGDRLSDDHLDEIYNKVGDEYTLTTRERMEMNTLIDFCGIKDPSETTEMVEEISTIPTSQQKGQQSNLSIMSKSMALMIQRPTLDATDIRTLSRRNRMGNVSMPTGDSASLSRSCSEGSFHNFFGNHATKPNKHKRKGGKLSSSIFSGKRAFLKLLANDKGVDTNTVDPTKQALEYLFYPSDTDPKSSLLKSGPIHLASNAKEGLSIDNERYLMIFSHGFVVASVPTSKALSLFLALNDEEILSSTSFENYLGAKFDALSLLSVLGKASIAEVLKEVGFPGSESIMSKLVHESKAGMTSESLCESWRAFHSDTSTSGSSSKVEVACLFSSICRIDCLDISEGDCSRCIEFANDSSLATMSFAVTLKGREDDPLIFCCSSNAERDAWIQSFKPLLCALEHSTSPEMIQMRKKVGWQHCIVRSSLSSLVVVNNASGLKRTINGYNVKDHRSRRTKLNALDIYNGYAPLHYAAILGHTSCIKVLLKSGSIFDLKDVSGLTPMMHAICMSDDAADVLEENGANREDSSERKAQILSMKILSEKEDVPKATHSLLLQAVSVFGGDSFRRYKPMPDPDMIREESNTPRKHSKSRSFVAITRKVSISELKSPRSNSAVACVRHFDSGGPGKLETNGRGNSIRGAIGSGL